MIAVAQSVHRSPGLSVYFIGENEGGCFSIKIGVAKNIAVRKRNLQVGNPRELRLLGWITADDDFGFKGQLKKHFRARRPRGEWFNIEPADILPFLVRAGRKGFVAKNADAFQITGYDSDAVPEYLGVWHWADLEIDVCCGLHFQEPSQNVLLHTVRLSQRLFRIELVRRWTGLTGWTRPSQ